jgi:hypothetical protein
MAFQTTCHLTYPYIKKKVRGGCALAGADKQKPYAPKCGQGKTMIDLFLAFMYKNLHFFFVEYTRILKNVLINKNIVNDSQAKTK